MIYVRVELWPWGMRDRARLLGEATISNVGGDAARGDYEVRLSRTSPGGNPDRVGFQVPAEVSAGLPPGKDTWRTAAVEGYPRLSLVVWHLIARALSAACAAPPLHRRKGGKS